MLELGDYLYSVFIRLDILNVLGFLISISLYSLTTLQARTEFATISWF